MLKKIIISTFALAGIISANAQTDSLNYATLNPVVITGTGTYHKADNSPVAVKVLSAKELKDAQVTNVQEALTRLTTNITLHTNGMGTFVNFNGVSDDYIIIMVNGKRVSGDDRWERMNINNIKRIEIYSGAASALYGSDAIAGVINIITEDIKEGVDASVYTQIRSKGRRDDEVNLDINTGKLTSLTSYSHHQADNWQVNKYQLFTEGDEQVAKLTGRPMSAGFHSNNLSEKLEWKFNDQWSAYIRGDFYDNLTDRPQNATYFTQKKNTDGTYSYTPKQAYTYDIYHKSYSYGGGIRWNPNNRTYLYLDVYSDNFVSKYRYWQTGEKEEYDETRKRTHYVNETLRGIFRLADWNKLSAGVELVQESLNSQSDNIDFETTNTYNVFAQDEISIAKGLEAVAGLRYTYNDNFGSNLTPNIGLFYHLGGFRLRASYAGGYRTPTLSQMYATDQAKTTSRYTINNTSLDPEKNHFFNLNAEYSNNWMNVSVSGFINKIRDMINYRTMTQDEIDASAELSAIQAEGWTTIRQRDNIDKATLKGISANIKFILPFGFSIAGGYTFTDSEAETLSLNSKTKEYEVKKSPVDKSVKHVGNVNAAWDKTWGNYHLNVSLNGHIQSRRFSSTYGYAPHTSIWNLTTRHSITFDQFILEPGIGIENIFNKKDDSYWNSNFATINPGRTLFISLALRFRK